jgi:hypothetical protein
MWCWRISIFGALIRSYLVHVVMEMNDSVGRLRDEVAASSYESPINKGYHLTHLRQALVGSDLR